MYESVSEVIGQNQLTEAEAKTHLLHQTLMASHLHVTEFIVEL
jgi:hypothetical protein